MQVAIGLFSIVVAVVLWVAAVLLVRRAVTITSRHAAQCSKIASELASSLARSKKLELEVGELGELCERLSQSVNKWRSRAAALSAKNDAPPDRLQGAAWKDAMRKRLRVGTPSVTSDSGGSTSEG